MKIQKYISKFYDYLILKEFDNKFFNYLVKPGIISILEFFLYSEFRKSFDIFRLLKKNIHIIIFILFIFFSYKFGYYLQHKKINNLKSSVVLLMEKNEHCNDTIDSLRYNLKIQCRNYIQHIIITDTKIGHYSNFNNLSDSIFFTMFDKCVEYKLPYTIFYRIIDHESGFLFVNNYDGSGATGYMQLMPQTFNGLSSELKLKGGNTPMNNIIAGAYYLKISHDYWSQKYSNKRDAWTWTIAEYCVGRGGLQDTVKIKKGDSVVNVIKYVIPNDIKPYIDYEMKYYNENDTFDISEK